MTSWYTPDTVSGLHIITSWYTKDTVSGLQIITSWYNQDTVGGLWIMTSCYTQDTVYTGLWIRKQLVTLNRWVIYRTRIVFKKDQATVNLYPYNITILFY